MLGVARSLLGQALLGACTGEEVTPESPIGKKTHVSHGFGQSEMHRDQKEWGHSILKLSLLGSLKWFVLSRTVRTNRLEGEKDTFHPPQGACLPLWPTPLVLSLSFYALRYFAYFEA